MTTIEDEEFFFFFVTLGIMCRLKWDVAALRGLWPRGVFWLMELMLTHGGIFGFPAGFQFLWASLVFKTSLNTFSLFAETHLVISEKLSSQTF